MRLLGTFRKSPSAQAGKMAFRLSITELGILKRAAQELQMGLSPHSGTKKHVSETAKRKHST